MTDTNVTPTHADLRSIALAVATNCCVCRLKLTDAESVEHGIGPICSKRYYNPLYAPTREQVMHAVGLLAVSGLPDNVIDGCLAASDKSDARIFSNILIYYASVHYDEREEVLKCSAIVRALGYVKLADKLEQDRTAAVILDKGTHIEAFLPTEYAIVKEVRKIPGVDVLMTTTDEDDEPLIADPDAPVAKVEVRAKRGRKEGWKVPLAARDHLDCIVSVFLGGQTISYGNSVLKIAAKRPKRDLFQYTNPPPTGANTASANTPGGTCSITVNGSKLEVRTPYNGAFVADLKNAVHWKERSWNGTMKFWEVNAAHRALVIQLIQQHYGVTLP